MQTNRIELASAHRPRIAGLMTALFLAVCCMTAAAQYPVKPIQIGRAHV